MSGPSQSEERTAWIALAAVDGLGEHLLPRIAAAFGSAAQVLDAARTLGAGTLARRLREAAHSGLRDATIAGVRAAADDPHAVTRQLQALDGWALTPWDPGYPPSLRVIDPPPPVLFGAGDPAVLSTTPLIAVVGTRRPTPLGRSLAGRVGAALASRGATVVSGLAIGIDAVAHAACLDAGGRTVGVIGGGLLHAGPRANDHLVRAIRDGGGVVVGEHPPDTVPTRGTFPRRNRIISGLSMATIVVEAPIASGALITARHALEQGRTVFAATGRPSDVAVAGCLALLRESPAHPLIGIEELLLDLGLTGSDRASAASPGRGLDARSALASLGSVERDVARLLLDGPMTTDSLVGASGHPAAVVAGALTLLQLRGWVVPLGPLQVPAGPLLLGSTSQERRARPTAMPMEGTDQDPP